MSRYITRHDLDFIRSTTLTLADLWAGFINLLKFLSCT
jgi:hypothetical protein